MNPYNNILITGSNGFSGMYLIRQLRSLYNDKIKIIGIGQNEHSTTKGVDHYFTYDIEHKLNIMELISLIKSDTICCFHLAGKLKVNNKRESINSHVNGTQNIIDSILQLNKNCRFVNIGSSAEYGYHGRTLIKEYMIPNPVTWYGITKYMQTMIANYYFDREGFDVVMIRTFNIIGPGQPESFVVGNIVSQAVKCKLGIKDKIIVGNTESYRDFIDIRDVVEAYNAVSINGISGQVYNVGSGNAIQIKKIIEIIKEIANYDIEVISTSGTSSKADIPFQCADITEINKVTKWNPMLSLKRTLKDMFEFEMNKYQ